jgi:hypothetical protein
MAYYNDTEDHYNVSDYTTYAMEMREEARERRLRSDESDWFEDARGEYLAQRAEYALHTCHGAGCDAEPSDTRQCEECGVYFCEDHLFGDKCTPCFKAFMAAEEAAAFAGERAAMEVLTRRAA